MGFKPTDSRGPALNDCVLLSSRKDAEGAAVRDRVWGDMWEEEQMEKRGGQRRPEGEGSLPL